MIYNLSGLHGMYNLVNRPNTKGITIFKVNKDVAILNDVLFRHKCTCDISKRIVAKLFSGDKHHKQSAADERLVLPCQVFLFIYYLFVYFYSGLFL